MEPTQEERRALEAIIEAKRIRDDVDPRRLATMMWDMIVPLVLERAARELERKDVIVDADPAERVRRLKGDT